MTARGRHWRRWGFVGRFERLRQTAGDEATDYRAGIINRFGPGITRLKTEPGAGQGALRRNLKAIVSGVRLVGHEHGCAVAADNVTGRIELGVGREARAGAGISIRVFNRRQLNACGANIRGVDCCDAIFCSKPAAQVPM